MDCKQRHHRPWDTPSWGSRDKSLTSTVKTQSSGEWSCVDCEDEMIWHRGSDLWEPYSPWSK